MIASYQLGPILVCILASSPIAFLLKVTTLLGQAIYDLFPAAPAPAPASVI